MFAEFENCRSEPRGERGGNEEEGTEEEGNGDPLPPPPERDDATAFAGSEDDAPQGEEEDDPYVDGESENERPRVRRRNRIPVRFLSGPDRGLLFPFAQLAHQSFQRRLANAVCSRVSEGDPEEEEETERERGGGNGNGNERERERERGNEEEENERERERETEEEEEGNEEEENERRGRRKFGFVVVRFVADAGSLAFRRAGRPELVCVEAESPRAALRAVRAIYQNVTGPVSVRRVSHAIAPHPPACLPARRNPRGENHEEEEPLEPTPDPLDVESDDVDSDDVQDGIPLFLF